MLGVMIDHAPHSLWTDPIIQPFGKNDLKNHFFNGHND